MPSIGASLSGLFFVSGMSGLMYEVIWVRMLTRILGNTVSATAIVLSAFMGGLGLGSLLIGRYADRTRRPLLVYSMLELGIAGAAGLSLGLSSGLLPIYRSLYLWSGESRASLSAAQITIASLFLLLPTTLMGASFPALCAFGNRRHWEFARHVGTLYALNAFGAVAGVLVAGFVSIGELGETNTVILGVALNVLVALFAIALSRVSERSVDRGSESAHGAATELPAEMGLVPVDSVIVRRVVLMTTGASGFIALASQVVWGRMLLLYQGTSVYAFSAMLAVILGGMGFGSLVGGRAVGRQSDPLRLLANLQAGVGLFILISLNLFGLGNGVRPDLSSGTHLSVMALAPVLFLGPLSLLWGLIFPVAARCYAGNTTAGGRSIAELYACNTLGCIAGAAGAGFVLIPGLGVSASAMALATGSVLLSSVILLVHPNGHRRTSWAAEGCLIVACALLLISAGDPYYRILSRQVERQFRNPVRVHRYEESSAGTAFAFSAAGRTRARQLWVDGVGMTVLVSVTKLMAHLPLWLADDPKDILVICFGMGTTVRSASRHEGLEVYAVDRIPAVFEGFPLFHPDDASLLRRPSIHTIVDDGRNVLLINPKKYDVITVDPAPPLYSAGAVSLYSREFFRLCHDSLNPLGVMCLWVPLGNASEVKAIMRTFFEVFPEATVWNSPLPETVGGCYLIGALQPIRGVAERVRRGFLDRAVVADLAEWGSECDRPEKILNLLVADRRRLLPWLEGVPVITDDHPYTEFPLWRAVFGGTDYHAPLSGEILRRQLMTAPENPAASRTESDEIQ